ncbi:DUF7684 family protein [Marinicellulosiphila megalodicopiae]|uniref:DUF7684 family protein n=1 Tax=Marinicellulosiphila megalodicopiae TaxID=2724896 RepID=UPI003BAEB0F6
MANKMYKVVLISESGYDPKHDELLLTFLDDKVELFCAVGKDCEVWENVMDELAIGDGIKSRYITTTCHPDESIEDVIEFANNFSTKFKCIVREFSI